MFRPHELELRWIDPRNSISGTCEFQAHETFGGWDLFPKNSRKGNSAREIPHQWILFHRFDSFSRRGFWSLDETVSTGIDPQLDPSTWKIGLSPIRLGRSGSGIARPNVGHESGEPRSDGAFRGELRIPTGDASRNRSSPTGS